MVGLFVVDSSSLIPFFGVVGLGAEARVLGAASEVFLDVDVEVEIDPLRIRVVSATRVDLLSESLVSDSCSESVELTSDSDRADKSKSSTST
jgi:hypothetical protein